MCFACNFQDITNRYCTNCGADLAPQHVQCPNSECGYSYLATQIKFNYCPRCGTAMPEPPQG